jgi:hypothetical protein
MACLVWHYGVWQFFSSFFWFVVLFDSIFYWFEWTWLEVYEQWVSECVSDCGRECEREYVSEGVREWEIDMRFLLVEIWNWLDEMVVEVVFCLMIECVSECVVMRECWSGLCRAVSEWVSVWVRGKGRETEEFDCACEDVEVSGRERWGLEDKWVSECVSVWVQCECVSVWVGEGVSEVRESARGNKHQRKTKRTSKTTVIGTIHSNSCSLVPESQPKTH